MGQAHNINGEWVQGITKQQGRRKLCSQQESGPTLPDSPILQFRLEVWTVILIKGRYIHWSFKLKSPVFKCWKLIQRHHKHHVNKQNICIRNVAKSRQIELVADLARCREHSIVSIKHSQHFHSGPKCVPAPNSRFWYWPASDEVLLQNNKARSGCHYLERLKIKWLISGNLVSITCYTY